MNYASVEDFVLRVGEVQAIELTDRDLLGEVNENLLEVALADSSSQIDGYLAARYTLPLATVPQNLVRLCCDLARYRLASMSGVVITDEIIERYKLSLKELQDISTGKVSLGLPLADEGADGQDNGVIFTNPKIGFLAVITQIEQALVERLQRGLGRLVSTVKSYGGELDDESLSTSRLPMCLVTFGGARIERMGTNARRHQSTANFVIIVAVNSLRSNLAARQGAWISVKLGLIS
ncbi:Mu-like prophage protein gp36 [Rodentibacter pneumotropicus]|uniref:Mu-like prophage protein gp36 n=1 Tax=Rodentibacter pneumotropicus TaxID=758 RepID=A0A448MPR7_9PAST|nr:Mu-like prophage protein gp36 [Rodentibacter pneumotropicus]